RPSYHPPRLTSHVPPGSSRLASPPVGIMLAGGFSARRAMSGACRVDMNEGATAGQAEADPRRGFPLDWQATTILSVRKGDRVAIGGDGQVTLGTQVMKAD